MAANVLVNAVWAVLQITRGGLDNAEVEEAVVLLGSWEIVLAFSRTQITDLMQLCMQHGLA